jgi:phosphatidylserine/phosphatidylglycerophosphate/cardiolipin synthase-like enzyme
MRHVILTWKLVLAVVLAACSSDSISSREIPELDAIIPADRPSSPGQEAGIDGGCGADCACEATSPRTSPTTVAVLPEAGEKPFVDLLDGAQTSIRVMVYLMGYGGILDRLKAKAKAGVDVRVILDKGKVSVNQKYRDQLVAAGAQVLWSDPKFPYMHAKVIIVDGKEAVLTTGNFSKKYSIDRERNFVARVSDPEDLVDLVALFEADWSRAAPDVSCTRLLVSPLNARVRLLELIDSATNTLTIESMQFADKDVRSHVAARRAAGVKVRAILADASWISANKYGAEYLKARDIEVRWIPHCHTKAIVVDGARAFVGSENLSYTSLSKNREIGVVLTQPAPVKVITDTFEKDWAVATPF